MAEKTLLKIPKDKLQIVRVIKKAEKTTHNEIIEVTLQNEVLCFKKFPVDVGQDIIQSRATEIM